MKQSTWHLLRDSHEMASIFEEDPEVKKLKKQTFRNIDEYPDNTIVFLCGRLKKQIAQIQDIDKWFDPPQAA